MISKLKHIVISEQNYVELKDLGKAADSFNDVITKLLRVSKSNRIRSAGENDDE